MERLTIRSGDTTHENGVCCTHFNSKECHEVSGNCAYGCKWEEEAWSKLCAYEDAEEQGLLLRLPCKVGDVLYQVISSIEEYEVTAIRIYENKIVVATDNLKTGIGFSFGADRVF